MPELPEVETVRRGLRPKLVGQTIETVWTSGKPLRREVPSLSSLCGQKIIEVERRAKYLLFQLENHQTLLAHLGMSGAFRYESDQRGEQQKHDHLILSLWPDHGKNRAENWLIYNDPRRFGVIDLAGKQEILARPSLAVLGLEPFDPALTPPVLYESVKKRIAPIKALLLDQSIIAGIGNIYAVEALWESGIAPDRPSNSLSLAQISALLDAVRAVLARAIEAGGATLRDHRLVDGSLGRFQHSFAAYDREGEPCPRPDCSGEIIRIRQSGRSSFFCPVHQV